MMMDQVDPPSGKVGHFTNTHTLGEGGTYQPPRSRQKHTAWVMCASSVMRACCVLMVMCRQAPRFACCTSRAVEYVFRGCSMHARARNKGIASAVT